MQTFREIIDHYESVGFASFCQNYKDRPVEELEEIIIDFQFLCKFGDHGIENSLIPFEDWIVFKHWELSTQTDFLAYLAIKIAVARS
jgi:hypothetical protein